MEKVQFLFHRYIVPPDALKVFSRSIYIALLYYYILQMLLYNVLYAFNVSPFVWIVNFCSSLKTFQFYIKAIVLYLISLLVIAEGCLKFFNYKHHYSSRFMYIINSLPSGLFYLIFCLLHGFLIGSVFMININEINYYYYFVSMWVMMSLYLPNSAFNTNPFIFPSVELRKFLPDIFDTCRLLSRSLSISLKIYIKFLVFSFVCHLVSQLPSYDVYILFRGLHLTIFLVLSKLMADSILNFLLVRRLNFTLNVDVESSDNHNPSELLTAIKSSIPILRYLGYYDLLYISQDKDRVRELFSLTYMKSCPLIWNRICDEIMFYINNFKEDLKQIVSTKDAFNNYQMYTRVSSMPQVDEKKLIPKIKILLYKFRFVSYFFEEFPETDFVNVIDKHSQSLALVCESLSNIACASITEDAYGNVQKRLTEIIHSLLELDRLLTRSNISSQIKAYQLTLLLKQSLMYSVKSSIYLLALKFGSYIKYLHLSPEDEQSFLAII